MNDIPSHSKNRNVQRILFQRIRDLIGFLTLQPNCFLYSSQNTIYRDIQF